MEKIAVIGAGAIGRAWAIVFARAGHPVALQSRTAETLRVAREFIAASLLSLREFGLLDETPEAIQSRIGSFTDLAKAIDGAGYVQENAPENLEAKQALFAQLDQLTPPEVMIASSTSTMPASRFAAHLIHRQRCLVAHPVNPPYLVPAVEIAPAPFTAPDVVTRACTLLTSVGQAPIVLKKEIPGFVMNRLQSLIACEAVRLIEDGYIDVEGMERAVKDGLGLRWSFMGPLEALDLNAAGGFAAFAKVFAPIMHAIDASPEAAPRAWSERGIAQIDAARRSQIPLSEQMARIAWRDRRLMALIAHKRRIAAEAS
jgi:3-hydroxyacyl-CoA dehydrogenase